MIKNVVFLAFFCLVLGDKCEKSFTQVFETGCNLSQKLKINPADVSLTAPNCGQSVPKNDFATQPLVYFNEAKDDQKYVLVMVDPDAPRHGNGKYFLHWVLADIKGSDFKKSDFKQANPITEYYKPKPPVNTGVHRYIFLVFQQNDSETFTKPAERRFFNLNDWLKAQKSLCGPIAGGEFKTQFE